METWLTPLVLDQVIYQAESFSVFRADRTEESGKSKGGQVCFMTNNSPNQEHLTILLARCILSDARTSSWTSTLLSFHFTVS